MNTLSSILNFIGNRIGKNSRVLLWTNPDYSANFPAQTIALDLTPYSRIEVDMGHSVTLNKGNGGIYYGRYVWTSTEGNCLASRVISATDTGVSFGNCYLMGVGNSTAAVTNNTSQIKPVRIYGVY